MPEQHSQSNVFVKKKSRSIPIYTTNTTKIHKTRRHRRRHNKYPSSHITVQTVDSASSDTIDNTSVPPTTEETPAIEPIIDMSQPSSTKETSVAVAEVDVETDPAVLAITRKKILAEPVVPVTPAIVEEGDEALSSWEQGDRKGLPYTFTVALHVGETLAVSLLFLWRTILTYVLLALLLTSFALLWQDMTATHVYVNALDANSGNVVTRQDLGGYHDAVRLTAPLTVNSSSAVLGVYAPEQSGTQQLLLLHKTTSSLSLQHSISLANGAITQDAHTHLLIENSDGLQAVTQDGQVVWHIQGQQPIHAVHPFAPTSDTKAVYTIASITHSQIAAYALTDGRIRWTQTLPDTLEYAPPFVVDDATLYVASDHNVFALNSSDGTVRWEKPYTARTLLLEKEGQQHLLALGPQGIQALQSDTGEVAWSFRGDSTISTLPTQFYQGVLSNSTGGNSNTVYATGVVWHMPTVREDIRLYAIDATTGTMRWSHQIASGPVGVDAGRLLQPLLDTENGMVVVQSAIRKDEYGITAYDARTGMQRWNTSITNRNSSSPLMLQISKHTYAVFTTTTNSKIIFWTPSFYRTCILLLFFISIVGLLLLLFLPQERGRLRMQRAAHAINVPLTFVRSRWRYAYTVSALALLCVCIGISIFANVRSNQLASLVLATDTQGSVVTTDMGDNTHQLEALNANGTRQWALFSSEGTFSVPKTQTQAGTLLVALQGDTRHSYVLAKDDPAYPRPLDTMFALYLLDRGSGHILWQQVVSYPDEQQNAEVIGVDTTYIYVAGEHTLTSSVESNAKDVTVPQLFAVNKLTGTVDWRIFGPTQLTNNQHSHSTLNIKDGQVLWHVANTIFTIDTNVGQIIGRG